MVTPGSNHEVASRLDEVATLLHDQGASPFRVRAYQHAAGILRELAVPVTDLLRDHGVEGLTALPGIGEGLAAAIESLASTGRLPLLDRLRGESDPVALLATVPGVGHVLAERVHHDLHIASLEDFEAAAHDGRLARVPGFGPQRVAGVRDALAGRLSRQRRAAADGPPPPAEEVLDVDAEYRRLAESGRLARIAPRRFNPKRKAWLPILHTTRGDRHYTALFSNTARAHRLGRTDDWVVVYYDGQGPEGQCTVVTEWEGPRRGHRVIRGRERECANAGEASAGRKRVS